MAGLRWAASMDGGDEARRQTRCGGWCCGAMAEVAAEAEAACDVLILWVCLVFETRNSIHFQDQLAADASFNGWLPFRLFA